MINRPNLSEKTRDIHSAVHQGELIAGLSETKASLGQISVRTENSFVALGTILQRAHEEGRAIEEKSLDIVALAEGDQGKGSLVKIKRLIRAALDELTIRREKMVSRSHSVQAVMGHLKQLQGKNADIERLAKYLRAVALNIFIETSRSQAVSENFSIIATEIKQLSETILALSKTIRDTVDESGNRFTSIFGEIVTGMDQLDSLTGDAERSVNSAVKQADDWVEKAGKAASYSVESHKIIMDRVGQVVMSLQFHDAMRQRLEHIETGLDDMVAMCRDPETAVEDRGRENRAMIYALSALLPDQLEQIIEDLAEVYHMCREGFDSINHQMAQSEEAVRGLTGGGASKYRSAAKSSDSTILLLDSLGEFMAVQTRGKGLVQRMDEAYSMVSQTASSLSDQIGEIHQISMDAHIKALNAIIAATHLGHEGKTLSVLAGEMKSLSDLTENFVRDVADIIDNLVSGSVRSGESEQDGDTDTTMVLNDVVRSLTALIGRMKDESGEMHENMALIRTTHKQAKETLEFMPVMEDDLRQQKLRLGQMKERLVPFKDNGVHAGKIHDLLAQRYTMEKERTVHRKSLSETLGIEDQESHEEEMDDNIELF